MSVIPFDFNYKMNDIINKFLLAADNFMSEMHLRQPQFTYSACGPFTSINKEFKNLCNQEMTYKLYLQQ